MARRRGPRVKRLVAEPFDEALVPLKVMERCVCYRTVTCDYTKYDVIEWLWPARIREPLENAHGLALHQVNTSYTHDFLRIPGPLGGLLIDIELELADCGMLVPSSDTVELQRTSKSDVIMQSLNDVAGIVGKYRQVRKVVDWLNINATPAAAKFYFPSLGALLPAGHAFHKTGELYREPKRPVAEIAHDMRCAMTTIAQGLLTYDVRLEREASRFKVEIRDASDPNALSKLSQTFCLI